MPVFPTKRSRQEKLFVALGMMRETTSGLRKSDLVINKTGYAVRKAKFYDINVVAQELARSGKIPADFRVALKGCVGGKRDSFEIDVQQHQEIKKCISELSLRQQTKLAKLVMDPKLASPSQIDAIRRYVEKRLE